MQRDCNLCAAACIDDDFFLKHGVVSDVALRKFLEHHLLVEADKVDKLMARIHSYLHGVRILRLAEDQKEEEILLQNLKRLNDDLRDA